MWSADKKVKRAIRNKTLASTTGLIFLRWGWLTEQRMFLEKHGRTNERKPNLPVAVRCFSFLSLYPPALLCVFETGFCGGWPHRWPKLERSGNVVWIFRQTCWRVLTHLSPHSCLSTENKFLFDILNVCLVLSFFKKKTMPWNECVITGVTRLRNGGTGQQMTHTSSRQTLRRPLRTAVPFRSKQRDRFNVNTLRL